MRNTAGHGTRVARERGPMDSGNDAFDDFAALFDPDLAGSFRADEAGLVIDPLNTHLDLGFGPGIVPQTQLAPAQHYAAPVSVMPAHMAQHMAPYEPPQAPQPTQPLPLLQPQPQPLLQEPPPAQFFESHSEPPYGPGPFPIHAEHVEPSAEARDSHRCPTCHKEHASQAALKRHMRFHSGERPFKCLVCGKMFAQKGDLKVHARSHTGETPFRCWQCGKQFAQFTGLKYHERVHSGERPVQCSQCGRAFVHTGDLNVHMRTHTGEKPFACFVCHKRFTQRGSVRVHMRRKHNQIVTKVPRTPDPALAAPPNGMHYS